MHVLSVWAIIHQSTNLIGVWTHNTILAASERNCKKLPDKWIYQGKVTEMPAKSAPAIGNNQASQTRNQQAIQSRHNLNIPRFVTDHNDPYRNAVKWEAWLKGFARKLHFFRVTSLEDKVDALYIYEGPELEPPLDNSPDPADTGITHTCLPEYIRGSGDAVNEYHKLSLKQEAAKCKFPDEDDAVRMKIFPTMCDKKLRREAMLKNLSLTAILSDAANREDVEHQAKEMEQMSQKTRDNKTGLWKAETWAQKFKPHMARFQPSQTKPKRDKAKTGNTPGNCDYCGGSHGGSCGNCPASGKMCNHCKHRGHFAKVCRCRKCCEQVHQGQGATADSDSDGDFVFSLSSNGQYQPTVKVMINRVKGKIEADSCTTANTMDYTQYMTIMNAFDKPVPLKPVTNSLYAYV